MKVLGAVLGGGRSRRFGSDKALALLDDRTLLEHAVAALRPHCARVAVVGRATRSAAAIAIADWPAPAMGPLGGLAGALSYARQEGFEGVLSCGVDLVSLPMDLPDRLRPGPTFVADQPVIGLWPVASLAALEAILLGPGSHAMRAFTEAIGARPLTLPQPLPNINRPEDLTRLKRERDAGPWE